MKIQEGGIKDSGYYLRRSLKLDMEYLNTKQAAEYLGLSHQFLEIARHRGEGPPFYKLSRIIRYRRAHLDEWMDRFRREEHSR